MKVEDFEKFKVGLAAIYVMYKTEISPIVVDIWWRSMKDYDLEAVIDGFNKHLMNPDGGQFIPKPADIVKYIGGSNVDNSMLAWSKVDEAIRKVGTYQTVVFDDPIIHAVIYDIGGWIALGSRTMDDWPFVGKEFQNRYRGYKNMAKEFTYPPKLIGIAEAQNNTEGFHSDPPILLGDPNKARDVMLSGSGIQRLATTPLTQLLK
jgi:hypothetical protein